jgi:branched-chain amino acid transport system permease protein
MSDRVQDFLQAIVPATVFLIVSGWAVPALFGSFWLKTFTAVAIYALASVGVGVLYGRLGLVSLANFALLGVGAWVSLRLSLLESRPPVVITILVGGFAAAAIGTLIGLPALRLRGLYLALVTLMGAGAFFVVVNAIGFPEGGTGFTGREGTTVVENAPRPGFATDDPSFFRFTLLVVGLGFLLVFLHLRARPGRAWALIRQSEAAAYSAGVNVTFYKTWAFTLAGFLAGVAGGLFAANVGRPSTGDFSAASSILLFALTLSAGSYNLVGAVIAGLLARALPALFTQWGINAEIANMIFGFLLMISLTAAPEGAAGLYYQVWDSIKQRLGFGDSSPASAPNEAAS